LRLGAPAVGPVQRRMQAERSCPRWQPGRTIPVTRLATRTHKVGQRIWEQVRDAVRAQEGDAFSFKDFHKRALDMGGVGLDTLRSVFHV